MTSENNSFAVILAGGSGTRFWPLSRHHCPKQFIPLLDGKTTFEATLERISALIPNDRCLVMTNHDHVPLVLPLMGLGTDSDQVIGEPVGRNTAPAVALAAAILAEQGHTDATMVILPADHYIPDLEVFHDCLQSGVRSCNHANKQLAIAELWQDF